MDDKTVIQRHLLDLRDSASLVPQHTKLDPCPATEIPCLACKGRANRPRAAAHAIETAKMREGDRTLGTCLLLGQYEVERYMSCPSPGPGFLVQPEGSHATTLLEHLFRGQCAHLTSRRDLLLSLQGRLHNTGSDSKAAAHPVTSRSSAAVFLEIGEVGQ